ncbi:MAG: type IX secretion system plug protein domain-containing protein, partial [Bacteroidota bacterium]
MKKTFLLLLLFASIKGYTQDVFKDEIFEKNIKTVLMYIEGNRLSFPVLDLRSSKKLIMTFDDLDAEIKDYGYT